MSARLQFPWSTGRDIDAVTPIDPVPAAVSGIAGIPGKGGGHVPVVLASAVVPSTFTAAQPRVF